MSKKYDYDLIVIGGGSGGMRAARFSTNLGAKVALCEADRMGGTCVIRGCIPKKLMVYGSEFTKHFQQAKAYGWNFESPHLDWEIFNRVRHKEIQRLENVYNKRLKDFLIDVYKGRGVLESAHCVRVGKHCITGRYILIAVGGKPHFLNISGVELALSSNDMFCLENQPRSLVVIGSGYIALEFASIFNELKTKVQVLFRGQSILRGFDGDVRMALHECLKARGVEFFGGVQPVEITKKGDSFCVKDRAGRTWLGDQVLMATGRRSNTDGLNLESLGVAVDSSGQIKVNQNWETSCSGVFAIGDCTNTPYALTPVATAEGMALSNYLFNSSATHSSKIAMAVREQSELYKNVPTVVFTQPPVGVVGLTEELALERGLEIEVFESRFRHLKLTLTSERERTYIKLIVCQKTRKVLGCHIVGWMAGEILQGFAVAVKAGLTKEQWDQTIGIHPTSAEELVTLRKIRTAK